MKHNCLKEYVIVATWNTLFQTIDIYVHLRFQMCEEFFAICSDMALHDILKVSSANVQGIIDKLK